MMPYAATHHIRMDGRKPVIVPAVSGGGGGGGGASATWSATNKAAGVILSADQMTASSTTTSIDLSGLATLAITSGQKVWVEVQIGGVNNHVAVGVGNASMSLAADGNGWLGVDANGAGYYSDGRLLASGAQKATYATFVAADVINMAIDRVAGTVAHYKNGVLQGTYTHGIVGDLYPAFDLKFGVGSTGVSVILVAPASFANAPPAGFTKYGA